MFLDILLNKTNISMYYLYYLDTLVISDLPVQPLSNLLVYPNDLERKYDPRFIAALTRLGSDFIVANIDSSNITNNSCQMNDSCQMSGSCQTNDSCQNNDFLYRLDHSPPLLRHTTYPVPLISFTPLILGPFMTPNQRERFTTNARRSRQSSLTDKRLTVLAKPLLQARVKTHRFIVLAKPLFRTKERLHVKLPIKRPCLPLPTHLFYGSVLSPNFTTSNKAP